MRLRLALFFDMVQDSTLQGKGNSIFSLETHGRDDLRYNGKKLTDPINTAEVI